MYWQTGKVCVTYIECFTLELHWRSDKQVPKLSNCPDGNLTERMLTDVLAEGLVQPLHTVTVLLCVLRYHGNDGTHQLLSHMAPCLQVHEANKKKNNNTPSHNNIMIHVHVHVQCTFV